MVRSPAAGHLARGQSSGVGSLGRREAPLHDARRSASTPVSPALLGFEGCGRELHLREEGGIQGCGEEDTVAVWELVERAALLQVQGGKRKRLGALGLLRPRTPPCLPRVLRPTRSYITAEFNEIYCCSEVSRLAGTARTEHVLLTRHAA
jgi:hypothetical protein